jgi:hypothetical protein
VKYFVQIWGFVIFGLIIKISGFAICGWHILEIWWLCWFRIWQFADFGSNDAGGTFFEKNSRWSAVLIRGPGENDHEKNLNLKISWHWFFKWRIFLKEGSARQRPKDRFSLLFPTVYRRWRVLKN